MGQLLYQVWPGKNTFFCGGRLVSGPELNFFYLTLFLIMAPMGVFFGLSGPYLVEHTTPAPIVVTALLFVVQMGSLITASMIDPGIIPRRDPNSTPTNQPSKEVTVRGGQVVTVKYCTTCRVYRPPRSSHCSTCDNCVDKFDHHCPWVGNCIGKRNYKYFMTFLISTTTMCMLVFSLCLAHLILLSRDQDHQGFVGALADAPAAAIILIYVFIVFWSVGGLNTFHLYLARWNLTTNESIKSEAKIYDEGCCKNWASIYCDNTASQIKFRSPVEDTLTVSPEPFDGSGSRRSSERPDRSSRGGSAPREERSATVPDPAPAALDDGHRSERDSFGPNNTNSTRSLNDMDATSDTPSTSELSEA